MSDNELNITTFRVNSNIGDKVREAAKRSHLTIQAFVERGLLTYLNDNKEELNAEYKKYMKDRGLE